MIRLQQRTLLRGRQVVWREADISAVVAAAAAEDPADGKGEDGRRQSGGHSLKLAVDAVARAAAGHGEQEQEQPEAMFCFETSLKALYWSNFMYYYQEVRARVPGACLRTLHAGMWGMDCARGHRACSKRAL